MTDPTTSPDYLPAKSLAPDIALFVALLATALALGAAFAHALELPNKIGMSREDYFVVQRIYADWNRLAFLLLIEAAAIVAVIIFYRRETRVAAPACAALGFLVVAQVIFWMWTFPANQATSNWLEIPANWHSLRSQWEYSHLAGAASQTLAMASLIIAALRRRQRP